MNYYTNISRDYNVSEEIFDDLWMNLYYLFKNLRNLFKEEGLEPWTSCEFDFTRDGKLNVSFDYIDWIKLGLGPLARENYYKYKNLELCQKWIMKWKKFEVEKYVKEQEEE